MRRVRLQVETPGDQPNPHMLTDVDGIVLRTDRTKDEVALSSQLPDAAFDELEKLRIEGPTGKVNFKVTGFARYTEKASRCGSVVVIYTGAGNVQFDGVAMTFDETVAGSFSRAGFKVRRILAATMLRRTQYAVQTAEILLHLPMPLLPAAKTTSLTASELSATSLLTALYGHFFPGLYPSAPATRRDGTARRLHAHRHHQCHRHV